MIEVSINEIEKGNAIVQTTGNALEEIVLGITDVSASIESTKDASLSQADSIRQINKGIELMTEVVESNSAAAEESSATSEELAAQAQNLDELVNWFKLK